MQSKYGNKHFSPSVAQHEHIDCSEKEKESSNNVWPNATVTFNSSRKKDFRALELDTVKPLQTIFLDVMLFTLKRGREPCTRREIRRGLFDM